VNIFIITQVVFMFPHVGGKMKIQLNRELLEKIFTSLPHILDTGGRFFLTLCKGSKSNKLPPFPNLQLRYILGLLFFF
jgi:hypothetical protein